MFLHSCRRFYIHPNASVFMMLHALPAGLCGTLASACRRFSRPRLALQTLPCLQICRARRTRRAEPTRTARKQMQQNMPEIAWSHKKSYETIDLRQ